MKSTETTSILITHDLCIGYQRTRQPDIIIGKHLNLTLHAGELVCLLGRNGVGKSTLMRTLARMQPPLSGTVSLMDDDLHALKPLDLAKRLSIVLTERPDVGLLTGHELIALGRHPYTDWTGRLSEHDRAMIDWAIKAVNAEALARLPVAELSDGQRQKIMIARALAQDPALILLDEPTAFLDLPRRVEIMRLLKQLTRETNRAILLSTHDLDLALRSADKLWLMHTEGEIHVGAPEDLILNGAFSAVFQSDGIEFDMQTGTFKVQDTHLGNVVVEGNGIRVDWTQRALQRAGYQVITQADNTSPRITVSEETWTLNNVTYQSIYTLLKALDKS